MVILARRVGVKYFIGFQLMLWGGLCMCHAAIRGSGTLIALRLLIGAAEAGFTQIGMFYLSTLYPKYDVGIRMGMFTGMYSVAGAFAGVLAYLFPCSNPVSSPAICLFPATYCASESSILTPGDSLTPKSGKRAFWHQFSTANLWQDEFNAVHLRIDSSLNQNGSQTSIIWSLHYRLETHVRAQVAWLPRVSRR